MELIRSIASEHDGYSVFAGVGERHYRIAKETQRILQRTCLGGFARIENDRVTVVIEGME